MANKIVIATVIACLASLLGGFGVGFTCGMKFQKTYQARKHTCAGYTVLDARHVITCDGDTIYHDWKKSIRFKK